MTALDDVACFVAADGFFSAEPAWQFVLQDPGRYRDLAGPEISAVMRQLPWRYVAEPVCIMALDANACALAVGWAGRTNLGDAGGVNLSYAAVPRMEGRGLASIAASLALVELDRRGMVDAGAHVHAQFDAANVRSAALAGRLGLLPDATLEARCALPVTSGNASTTRHIVGASGPWELVLPRARSVAADRQVIAWAGYERPRRERERS